MLTFWKLMLLFLGVKHTCYAKEKQTNSLMQNQLNIQMNSYDHPSPLFDPWKLSVNFSRTC